MTPPTPRIEALKPCPFCGKTPAWIYDKQYFQARCINKACEAEGPAHGSYDLAFTAWNTRAADSVRQDGWQDISRCITMLKSCQEVLIDEAYDTFASQVQDLIDEITQRNQENQNATV